jgi:hypothetical protein
MVVHRRAPVAAPAAHRWTLTLIGFDRTRSDPLVDGNTRISPRSS